MSLSRMAVASSAFVMVLLLMLTLAWGSPGYFDTSCAGCHQGVAPTCNGCHPHGVRTVPTQAEINLTAVTDKGSYGAGENIIVTVSGGNETGWVRVTLYDEKMEEMAQSAGPAGIGGGAGFPLSLSAPAPGKSGSYRWTVGWYGARGEGPIENIVPRWVPDPENPEHGEELMTTNTFTVVAGPEPTVTLDPGLLDFGMVPAGTEATRTVQVTNPGTALLSISDISLCPGTSSEFTWTPSFLLVPPGGSEALQVTLTSTGNPRSRGCLRLATNDPETPVMLLLLHAAPELPIQ